LDGLYPKRACTVPHEHGHVTDDGEPVDLTTVERQVVGGVSRVEQDTQRLLWAQAQVVGLLPELFRGYRAWDSERRPDSCPRCGFPFPRGSARCDNLVDDGEGGKRRCEASKTDHTCENANCAIPIPPGNRRVKGADGKWRCKDCNQVWKLSGRERIPKAALELGDNVLTDGVFTTDGDLQRLERMAQIDQSRAGRATTPAAQIMRQRRNGAMA
jgi:hypothetical protein